MQDVVIADTVTGSDGKMSIKIGENGNYSIAVTKEGYTKEEEWTIFQCTLDNCHACSANLTLKIDQPRCSDVEFPVTVTDYHDNEKPVPNANVDLYQIATISGVSNTFIDRQQTDENGTAIFTLQMNGNYTVKISAAGYVSDDADLEHECNHFHCQECNPVLHPQIKKSFCENKTFEMIVINAVDNTPVGGANLLVWMDVNSIRDGKRNFKADEVGYVNFPILANGVYNFEISKEGFLSLTRTFTVDVQPGDCNEFLPVDLSPLSPSPLCERGARVSLIWGEEPADLDLYSHRVNNNDTSDTCLTYYCDGKDPCNGTTHDVDNKYGGLNGTETITYCNTEDYVNMIFVDDLSGRGESLISSSAKLIIQANNQSVEIPLSPKGIEEHKNNRYWLAGCLLLESDGFVFLEVNEVRDGQPDVDTPHFCYNLVQLKRQREAEDALPNANLVVNVKKENTIFYHSSIEVETPSGLARYQETGRHGNTSFSIYENGWYDVTVRAHGYSPAVERVFISCNHTEVCTTDVNLALSLLKPEGSIKIKLNWEEDLNLDLHTVRIDSVNTDTHCETFYGQQSVCRESVFGSDIKTGGMPTEDEGETITLESVANNPTYTYMVFVHDNSPRPDLPHSTARLSLLDGNKAKLVTMPAAPVSEMNYWLAGCVAIVGDFFHYVSVNKFTRTSPVENDKWHCVELLSRFPPPSPAAFCMGKSLKINIRDSENNTDITGASIDVMNVQGQEIDSVNITTAMTNDGRLALSSNGVYKVHVDKDDYQSASNEVRVSCDINMCRDCNPEVTIPMIGELDEKQSRILLVWQKERTNPGLYAIQKNMETGDHQCVAGPNNDCSGVTENDNNDDTQQNHFKSISISSNSATEIKYFTVVVNLQSKGNENDLVNEEIKNSKVHVIITDSFGESLRVNMRTQTYNKDKYWIVGCIGGEHSLTATFTEINMFLDTPPEQGEDYCAHFVTKGKDAIICKTINKISVTGLTNCFARLKGPSYAVADNGGLVGRMVYNSAKECADKCTLMEKCQAFDWYGPGDEQFRACYLYKSGRLSGYLDDGRIRYASICPKKGMYIITFSIDLSTTFHLLQLLNPVLQRRHLSMDFQP